MYAWGTMENISPDNIEAFIKLFGQAAATKNVPYIIVLSLIAIVFVLRKFVLAKVPFFQSKLGGVLLVVVTSLLGALATSLAAGTAFSGPLLLAALNAAVLAGGGWKMLIEPIIDLVLKRPDPALIKAEAEKAGQDAAVKADPGNIVDFINKKDEPK